LIIKYFCTVFARDKYYSLTEIYLKFQQVMSRAEVKNKLAASGLHCIENLIQYGNYYSIAAKYYLKEDIENLFAVSLNI